LGNSQTLFWRGMSEKCGDEKLCQLGEQKTAKQRQSCIRIRFWHYIGFQECCISYSWFTYKVTKKSKYLDEISNNQSENIPTFFFLLYSL